MKKLHNNTDVGGVFYAPVIQAIKDSNHIRACKEYTDYNHITSGIQRVITSVASGRDWVQKMHTVMNTKISVQVFFSALKSARRLKVVKDISNHIYNQANKLMRENDPLANIPELNGFAVFAADGHTHKPSVHEKLIEGIRRPVTHIYSLNLRSHALKALALSVPQETKKKEHEMSTLKRVGPDLLRMSEPIGTKVILVYDPAVIDYKTWFCWKQSKGLYVLTVEKKNSKLITLGYNNWDENDPRNNGVINDEIVGPSNGHPMRRITYVDPVKGKTYRFITNEMTLPPGVLAFLYKLRWDVEKTFDQIKNKMSEKKAWGASENAKEQQASFIAIAHNLMLMLETYIQKKEGIHDKISQRKRQKRLSEDIIKAKNAGRQFNWLVENCHRTTQRCFQFIRWLRCSIEHRTSWAQAIEELRPLMANYI